MRCQKCGRIVQDGWESFCPHFPKRTAPAGSLPASGSRTRVAGSKPDATLTFASASPFADQVEEIAVAMARKFVRRMFARAARDYRAAISGTQSDQNEDERCPACGAKAVFVTREGRDECMMCGHQWTPGDGVERSGSAND